MASLPLNLRLPAPTTFSANAGVQIVAPRLREPVTVPVIPTHTERNIDPDTLVILSDETRDVAKDEWQLFVEGVRRMQMAHMAQVANDTSADAQVRYPAWLTAASAVSLLAAFGGAIAIAWDTTIGAGIAGLGFVGIWVFGNIVARKRSAT